MIPWTAGYRRIFEAGRIEKKLVKMIAPLDPVHMRCQS